jgi:hypothetical protein
VADLRRGQLVGLEDGDHAVHAGRAVELEAGDVLAVPDGADDGHLVARAGMRSSPDGLDPLDDGLNLLGRRVLLHHDHHASVPFRSCFDKGTDGAR